MSKYPVSRVCPECGSRAAVRRGSSRVCRDCLTRYVPPDTADRVLFGLAFVIPGLLFCAVAVFFMVGMATDRDGFPPAYLACPGAAGLMGLIVVALGIKEMGGRRKPAARKTDGPAAGPAPAVSKAMAAEMVQWVEEVYRTGTIRDQLGTLRFGTLDDQVAWFASEWEDDERPLFFVDTSRAEDGTAGILVSDRRLYASSLDEAIALADVSDVTCEEPSGNEGLFFLLAILLLVFCLFFGAIVVLFRSAVRAGAATRHLSKRRLLVNGKVLYAARREFESELWVELLTSLGSAARAAGRAAPGQAETGEETSAPQGITRHVGLMTEAPRGARAGPSLRPVNTTLETLPYTAAGIPLAGRTVGDPTWEQVESSIRQLDGYAHPLVRLWAGRPGKAPGLEIIGGSGKYALREVCDGWVYYDPNGSDEEVEVQASGGGHRCAGYYVCTDVDRVLRIARRFCETGAAGDDETS